MKGIFFKSILFLLGILAVGIYLATFIKSVEGFSDAGSFLKSINKPILDDYPLIGKNETSNNNYNKLWWRYPIFSLGSYEQITNNLQHLYNPDNGTCVRADFCGALYHDNKNTKSNIITPLPPAEEGLGARVGYFRTEPNELYYSIPTNENILY
jgi:hypothetical protein